MSTGVMFFCDQLAAEGVVQLATRLESLHYDRLWLPELFGREVFSSAAFVLSKTERLSVASGIANVYARDAYSAAQARQTLAELSNGRFALGLGVSNPGILSVRGQPWRPPLVKLREYLTAIAQAKIHSPAPMSPAPIYIAAHGPKLLRLACEQAQGANTYLMPCAHTEMARLSLGRGPRLNVVVHCLAEQHPERARRLARRAVGRYLGLDYYQRMWSQYGYDANDFDGEGSDRLIDMLVAWGSMDAIGERIEAQRRAGADEVIVVPLNGDGGGREPDWSLLEALAPGAS
ncbi:MAG: LLM class flavin-dependent oxidoreductase [Pseudomonadota bacterium]